MHSERLTSPQMIVCFICATFGAMSFCSGFFSLSPDTIVAMGIIRLVLGIIYFIGALINIFKGLPGGNLNLISAVCFGLFAGGNMLLSALYSRFGIEIQPLIYCIVQIFGATYIIFLLPALGESAFYNWILQLAGALGLLSQAFQVILNSKGLQYAGGLFFLIYGLCSLYGGLSSIVVELPQGLSAHEIFQRLFKKTKSQ